MARPKKNGLSYFPLDADFFEDNKIKILKARYKADGITMYIYLLCEIYKQGYYIEVDDDFEFILSDDLGIDQNKVKQVLNFLLKRSLFDDKLFNSDKVLTSAGIQRRFQIAVKERARKNPVEVGRYWLLKKEDTEPFIKCCLFEENPGNKDGFSGKNADKSAEESLKESKVNKSIYTPAFQSADLEEAFQMYLLVRRHNHGDIIPEQVQALRDELSGLSDDDGERLAIVKKATAGGWKNFYRIRKEKAGKAAEAKRKNQFSNFEGRSYDMRSLEIQLVEGGKANGKDR